MTKKLLPDALWDRIAHLFAPVAARPETWASAERTFGIGYVQRLQGVTTK
jgi:hypothetical protein